MTQQAESLNRPEMALSSRRSQLLVVFVLCVICCATALAATSPIAACDRTVDLQSLDVPVSDLIAIVVGHVVVDPEDQDDATIDILPDQGLSEAPILDLAPRVAVILQEVFSAVAIETPSSDATEQPFVIETLPKREAPLSPVAGDATQTDSSDLADPASGIEDVIIAPSIQRQMYRTDI